MNPQDHPVFVQMADLFLGQKDTFHRIHQWQDQVMSPPEVKTCMTQTGKSALQCICQNNTDCETAVRMGQQLGQQLPHQISIQVCQTMFENQHQVKDQKSFMSGCVAGLWN